MNYEQFFEQQLSGLRREGRYRTFAHLKRCAGDYPKALSFGDSDARQVTVWCSNDYLGMGQHPAVLSAMEKALKECGAGAGGTLPVEDAAAAADTISYELLVRVGARVPRVELRARPLVGGPAETRRLGGEGQQRGHQRS